LGLTKVRFAVTDPYRSGRGGGALPGVDRA
jgi:hypothetical protein